ncbi:MAG: hypothetical protein Q6373_012540, partial [Candidatus Sigynarchaeota archaeon]
DIPIYEDEETREEFFTLADFLRAEQKRVARKHGITVFNTFELLTLYADVKSKIKGIKQKFRFNKIMFYIGKRLEKEFGEGTLIFDEMCKARAGPVPRHLGEDMALLEAKGLVKIHVDRDGKKIPGSEKEWRKLIKNKVGACVVELTPAGEDLARSIWAEADEDILDIIYKVKRDLIYLDTEQLKEKVHKEYPEWKKDYVENDTEDWGCQDDNMNTCA